MIKEKMKKGIKLLGQSKTRFIQTYGNYYQPGQKNVSMETAKSQLQKLQFLWEIKNEKIYN